MMLPGVDPGGFVMTLSIFRKVAGTAIALVIAAAIVPAAAQESTPSSGVFKTGRQVYDLCVSKVDGDVDMCDYFIMAAHDMIKLYGDTDMAEGDICLPKGVTALEVRNVVLDYWKAKTSSLQYSAVSSIRNALIEKYSC